MASSFREILWLDTDITLLYRPEELFDSPQYQSTSALSSESTLLRHASQKRPSKIRGTGALFWPEAGPH